MKNSLSFLVLMFFLGVASDAFAVSAHRPAGTDYRDLVKKYRQSFDGKAAYDAAVSNYTKLNSAAVPQEKEVQKLFLFIRDHQELSDELHPSLNRRIPWLYPHEGCWVRASIANTWAEKEKFTRPGKLFMFGNLEAKTPNSSEGKVTWWYHVAPVIKDANGDLFVIDPAINPTKPLTVKEELEAISGDALGVRVSLCTSYTYEPFDDCSATSDFGGEVAAFNEVTEFLNLEWSNLLDLGRVPEKELGSEPPWH